MIEFYALLGLVVSIMMFANIPVSAVDKIAIPEVAQAGETALKLLTGVAA